MQKLLVVGAVEVMMRMMFERGNWHCAASNCYAVVIEWTWQ